MLNFQDHNVQLVVNAADLRELFMGWQEEFNERIQAIQNEKDDEVELTADEVATLLGVTKVTLWRWAKTGYLVPSKIGRRPKYRKGDIKKLMNVGG